MPSSNGDPPEARNRAPLRSRNGAKERRHSSIDLDRPRGRKLLGKSKDDILVQPRKDDFETKMTAKEIERAKKWQNMAAVERTKAKIHFRFPYTKKVVFLGRD